MLLAGLALHRRPFPDAVGSASLLHLFSLPEAGLRLKQRSGRDKVGVTGENLGVRAAFPTQGEKDWDLASLPPPSSPVGQVAERAPHSAVVAAAV